jgi:23S rRNA (cytosine1962-C5)-methyltransferase
VLSVQTGSNAWRAFYGESDGLPGLIVDKYADFLVAQIQTLGMHLRRDAVLDAIEAIYKPAGIFEKSDPEMLAREGVSYVGGTLRGAEPTETVRIEVDNLAFNVNIRSGQKTGFFLDQRDNRKVAAWYSGGKRVLDAFCHTGAFALYAAKMGRAEHVLGIDSSAAAVELAKANAELNDVRTAEFRTGKLPEALRELRGEGRLFDLVILDPPSFARTRPGLSKALFAYRELNASAMRCTEPGGVLVTCSCSQHVLDEDFELLLNEAAYEAGRTVQVIERRSQSPDHPVIISCPQTRYLKCYVCRVL